MAAIHEVIDELIKKHGDVNKEIAEKLSEHTEKEISPQRIGQYRKGPKVPGSDFILLWEQVFGENILDLVKLKETIVSRGTENLTPVDKSEDKKDFKEPTMDEIIANIVEGNTEYILIHKVIIMEKYRLMPIEELDKSAKELERREIQITGLYEIIKMIAGKIPEIKLSDFIKLPEVNEAK
jgi:transcriptional regulator with XRE-family HTH domain